MRVPLLVSLCALALGCGDDDGNLDAGGDSALPDTGEVCTSDASCDDGTFCNGAERCDPTDPGADASGCAPGTPPCETGCDESARACEECRTDADGDGAISVACGGGDCDDDDPTRFPGATELCDAEGVDEDCDPLTFGFRDADMDGSNDARCCNGDLCGDDCDDMRPSVHGLAPEVCDTLDNDCDGAVDEGVLQRYYPDLDGDSFGDDMAEPVMGCMAPEDHVLENNGDCDDTDGSVNPGAFDICDAAAVDHDCDGVPNNPPMGCDCADGTMRLCPEQRGECEGGMQTCSDGTWGTCNRPPTSERCNDLDDDCDGATDEELPTTTYYLDMDSDSYGDPDVSVEACERPTGYVTDSRDCYDDNADARPGQTAFFTAHRGDMAFDYDCDALVSVEDAIEARCGSAPACGILRTGYITRPGPPHCGMPRGYANTCRPDGDSCVPIVSSRLVACR